MFSGERFLFHSFAAGAGECIVSVMTPGEIKRYFRFTEEEMEALFEQQRARLEEGR